MTQQLARRDFVAALPVNDGARDAWIAIYCEIDERARHKLPKLLDYEVYHEICVARDAFIDALMNDLPIEEAQQAARLAVALVDTYLIEINQSDPPHWVEIDRTDNPITAQQLVDYFSIPDQPIPPGLRPPRCKITGSYEGFPIRYRKLP